MSRPRSGTLVRASLLAATVGLTLGLAVARTPALSGAPEFQQAIPGSEMRWYKGNTHAHTLNSDGDSTPDDVVRWYREHGYHFLVLTDHNYVTRVDALNDLHGAAGKFLVVQGEEVTSSFQSRPVHVNGLGITEHVEPARDRMSVVETIQYNVDGIRRADGIPHINHPNFGWALTPDDLRQVQNNRLFEVYNGHPAVHSYGGGGVPSLDEAWDLILSQGVWLYGLAVDDAHTFKQPGNPNVAGPGRGWIAVRAPHLDTRTLLDAIERGDFYASTGVELVDVRTTATSMTVEVRPTGGRKHRIHFIGQGGRLLRDAQESTATYTFTGDEGYVRAKVYDSIGNVAWIQPVRVQ
ncbi:MAG TPA: CehA/McbA family metallohydrolase [Vicinamibacterales bacterium]|nr:CehA/McbA family metallohydrolase [Vicinamibacterales bacterium]